MNKLIKFVLLIFFFSAISITIILFAPMGKELKDGIVAEIIGSGILGSMVAGIFFYLQESNEFQASKNKAESFFKNNLLADILEVSERGVSIWNLSGANKFYLDGSFINPLFDVYQNNHLSINDYGAYFPENSLIKEYDQFYKLARKGYVLGEKIDNAIKRHVRAEHHKQGIIAFNDGAMIEYLKGKLFANFPDSEMAKYLEWQSVPERAAKMLTQFSGNVEAEEVLASLRETRIKLLQFSDEIIKLSQQEA